MHELGLLSLCRPCPRIVRLHAAYDTPSDLILVMDYACGGDLQSILDADIIPFEHDAARFIRQLVEALVFLHDKNIVHLDIKPQNLVLTGPFPDCDIKLCDLEISRVLTEEEQIREILGTPDYVAPEILHFEPISLAADIWSTGVLAYVLLTGFTPFGGDTDQETFCNISKCQVDFPNELFEDVSETAKEFIKRLLLRAQTERPLARDCLRFPWLATSRHSLSHQKETIASEAQKKSMSAAGGCPRSSPLMQQPALQRHHLTKSREILLNRVASLSNLRKSTSKSRERLCEMRLSLSRSRDHLMDIQRAVGASKEGLGQKILSKSQEFLCNKLNSPNTSALSEGEGSLRQIHHANLFDDIGKLMSSNTEKSTDLLISRGQTFNQSSEVLSQPLVEVPEEDDESQEKLESQNYNDMPGSDKKIEEIKAFEMNASKDMYVSSLPRKGPTFQKKMVENLSVASSVNINHDLQSIEINEEQARFSGCVSEKNKQEGLQPFDEKGTELGNKDLDLKGNREDEKCLNKSKAFVIEKGVVSLQPNPSLKVNVHNKLDEKKDAKFTSSPDKENDEEALLRDKDQKESNSEIIEVVPTPKMARKFFECEAHPQVQRKISRQEMISKAESVTPPLVANLDIPFPLNESRNTRDAESSEITKIVEDETQAPPVVLLKTKRPLPLELFVPNVSSVSTNLPDTVNEGSLTPKPSTSKENAPPLETQNSNIFPVPSTPSDTGNEEPGTPKAYFLDRLRSFRDKFTQSIQRQSPTSQPTSPLSEAAQKTFVPEGHPQIPVELLIRRRASWAHGLRHEPQSEKKASVAQLVQTFLAAKNEPSKGLSVVEPRKLRADWRLSESTESLTDKRDKASTPLARKLRQEWRNIEDEKNEKPEVKILDEEKPSKPIASIALTFELAAQAEPSTSKGKVPLTPPVKRKNSFERSKPAQQMAEVTSLPKLLEIVSLKEEDESHTMLGKSIETEKRNEKNWFAAESEVSCWQADVIPSCTDTADKNSLEKKISGSVQMRKKKDKSKESNDVCSQTLDADFSKKGETDIPCEVFSDASTTNPSNDATFIPQRQARSGSVSSDTGCSELSSDALSDRSSTASVSNWENGEKRPETKTAETQTSSLEDIIGSGDWRVRNRSNSVQADLSFIAQPWGRVCTGSVARAFEKFGSKESDRNRSFRIRRQSTIL
ncbi:probable serine/threonine-protein kinase DDB_G0278665 isoform X2 [Artemia franciscana]|nr:hypothetical protein QYM36_016095 [Artemia franciscana]